MATLFTFKKLFKGARTETASYKHSHFLNSLARDKVGEMLLFSEAEQVCVLLPEFSDRRVVFFNDQAHKFVFKKVLAREPRFFVNYIYDGQTAQMQSPGSCTLYGGLTQLPLKGQHFDVAICPFVQSSDASLAKVISQISGRLKNGGYLVFSVRHPQLEHMLFNQNPAETGSPDNSVSKYFRLLRENHLYTEEVREGMVDLTTRPFFVSEGVFDHYHEYKGTPLTLAFRAVKFVRTQK